MKDQIQTQNCISEILVRDANLSPKNMGAKFCFKIRIPSTLAQN